MGDKPLIEEIRDVEARAETVFTAGQIDTAIARWAAEITARIGDANPVLLGVMTGAIVPLGVLMTRLDFPLQLDYVHATRYDGETQGGTIRWIKPPPETIRNRTVLLVDDVLDHGLTLQSIVQRCRDMQASEVLTAVLVDKHVPHAAGLPQADFTALKTGDRYLFGWGMDYKTYLRNGGRIAALKS